MAPATAFQESDTWLLPGVAVTVGATEGPAPHPLFVGAGVAHAMPWRSKAAWIAVMCGVPSFRSPLSSSAVIHCM